MSAGAGPPRILVVEDNPITIKMLRVTLESEGYSVIAAATAEEALSAAGRYLPDLVLQDIVLPDLDGFELVRRLRNLPGGRTLPILALTGFLPPQDQARATNADFTAILVKPVEPSRLVEVVASHLPSQPTTTAAPGESARLLLVDDDPVQLRLGALHLGNAGFSVTTAGTAEEALRLARARPPDLVVSDVLMAGMDGFDLCLAVRQDPALAHLPVVLVSAAYGTELDRELARKAGANDLVTRSPAFEGVVTAAREALRTGPPPELPAAAHDLRLAHAGARIRQLEARLSSAEELSRRCVLQATQLAVVSGIADALAERSDVEAAIRDVLAATLDAAGISKGAIFLATGGGRFILRQAVGFSPGEREALANLFGHAHLLRRVASGRATLGVPSAAVAPATAADVLAGLGATSAQFVPMTSQAKGAGVILLASRHDDAASADVSAFARAMGNQLAQSLALADSFARIAASEQRYRALMEHAGDAISVLTPDGVVREVNSSWEKLFGIPRDQAIGRSLDQMVSGAAAAEGKPTATPPVGGGALPRAFRRADGSEVLLDSAQTAIEVGGECLVLNIARDVTVRMRSQAQLMAADRMASIGLLAAGVAHEINNPLAAMMGNLELATSDLERAVATHDPAALEQLSEDLRDASDAAERVRKIVRDLRIFSRATEDRQALVDVHSVLDSALRIAHNEIRHRARVVRAYQTVPFVNATESRLGQVFLNVLVNAAHALPSEAGGDREIRLQTRCENEAVVIEIADTGEGMPPQVLAQVFTPFFTTKPAGIGTGLGLSICQRIVHSLGGEIAIDSAVGQGTTVRITLPAATEGTLFASDAPDTPGPSVRRGRILVVDDDKAVADLVARALGAEHEVQLCESSPEALRRLQSGEVFDLVLCDLMMPALGGAELHARLAESRPELADDLVFLTGGAFTPEARAFLERVPNERLEKPFTLAQLHRLVHERLSGRRRSEPQR